MNVLKVNNAAHRLLMNALFIAAVVAMPRCVYGCDVAGGSLFPQVDFGSIPVPKSKPPGWVIAERFVNMANVKCYLSSMGFDALIKGTQVVGYPNVFTTNVEGVGVRVKLPPYFVGRPARYAPFQDALSGISPISITQSPLKVELIKIGPIKAGAALSGPFYTGKGFRRNYTTFESIASFSGGTFQNISCTPQNVVVNLPAVSLSAIARNPVVGRAPFAISIHCASIDVLNGIDYQFSNVTPILDPANGVIALDGSSSAKGVGIQVIDRQSNTPIQFQHRYTLAHFMPGAVLYQIPLIAAYYRTGVVQAGTVSSSIEFTLYYK